MKIKVFDQTYEQKQLEDFLLGLIPEQIHSINTAATALHDSGEGTTSVWHYVTIVYED